MSCLPDMQGWKMWLWSVICFSCQTFKTFRIHRSCSGMNLINIMILLIIITALVFLASCIIKTKNFFPFCAPPKKRFSRISSAAYHTNKGVHPPSIFYYRWTTLPVKEAGESQKEKRGEHPHDDNLLIIMSIQTLLRCTIIITRE